MQNYTLSLHGHSVYSQRDAIIKLDQAAEKIKAAGCTHYALTDHGTVQGWLALRDACKKTGLIPMYGCEVYVNDALPLLDIILEARASAGSKTAAKHEAIIMAFKQNALRFISAKQAAYICADLKESSLAEQSKKLLSRLRFGYGHLVCVAISGEGRQNLIRLVNKGWMEGHHYKPQVTTDDVLAHSDGVIFTSACLISPLARRLRWDESGQEGLEYVKRFDAVRDRFYLEVMPLDLLPQRKYNDYIIKLARQTGHRLVLSQDNHHLEKDEWIAHRIMMLAQNSEPIEAIEAFYDVKGEVISFSALKKRLGYPATWQVQQYIEQEDLTVARPAGHHYGDISLHWRTNEIVRQECEITNPELLPVLDECFEVSRELCETVPEVKWPETFRMPRHEGAREKVLQVCVGQMENLDLIASTEVKPSRARGVSVMGDAKESVDKEKQYLDWLKREDRVIDACGFYDYLWTLYLWTKRVQEEGIPIGYARGSGGGCLIMYLLGIIRVDPVKYGLYFDRFLNPARLGLDPNTLEQIEKMSSIPDVDLDFSSIHRPRVIQIAKELFGDDHVVPVGTITEMKFKSALADLCRVVGISQQTFMPVSKELPDDPTNKLTMDQAMENQAFKQFVTKHPIIQRFLPSLVGTMRSTGQHAGGVCIADVPIAKSIPVVRAGSKEGGNIVTAFGESGGNRALESIGYIKFDALATDTVDHLSLCARLRYENHLEEGGEKWIEDGVPFLYPEQMPDFKPNDPAVMEDIFHSGDTDGIFQMEENIGKSQCELIKPDSIDELSDISTMIRPGCLQAPAEYNEPHPNSVEPTWLRRKTTGLHLQYAARKFYPEGNPPPNLPQPILEVLEPTHYCCIYQEQMMWLIQRLSGNQVSLGEGDVYRRNIELWGKQIPGAKEKVLAIEQKVKDAQAYPADIVDTTCAIIKGGANYSFNKAHSLSYSLFSYGQAWFKHYYPHIFYAAHVTLLAEKNKLDKVHKIINNARSRGIAIKAPHVRHSSEKASWSDDGKTIYLPFAMMKGFKRDTAMAIFDCGHACDTIEDFLIGAIAHKSIKKNHTIALAKVGALDDLGATRLQAMAMASYVTSRASTRTKPETIQKYCDESRSFYPMGKVSRDRALKHELEVFGGFINESPLDRIEDWLLKDGWNPLSTIEALENEPQRVFFLITSIQKKTHRTGNNVGKEWYKLICWDGLEVCELCIWNYDLDGTEERIGYRPLVQVHKVFKAYVQWDGQRPVSLSHRSWLPPGAEALHTVPTDMGVRE